MIRVEEIPRALLVSDSPIDELRTREERGAILVSAEQALQMPRVPDGVRFIWIDAMLQEAVAPIKQNFRHSSINPVVSSNQIDIYRKLDRAMPGLVRKVKTGDNGHRFTLEEFVLANVDRDMLPDDPNKARHERQYIYKQLREHGYSVPSPENFGPVFRKLLYSHGMRVAKGPAKPMQVKS